MRIVGHDADPRLNGKAGEVVRQNPASLNVLIWGENRIYRFPRAEVERFGQERTPEVPVVKAETVAGDADVSDPPIRVGEKVRITGYEPEPSLNGKEGEVVRIGLLFQHVLIEGRIWRISRNEMERAATIDRAEQAYQQAEREAPDLGLS